MKIEYEMENLDPCIQVIIPYSPLIPHFAFDIRDG